MRYVVHDLPPHAPGAFSPTMPMPPIASSHGLICVVGSPGTMAFSAPKPGVHSISPDPRTQGSWNVPDVIRPAVYYTRPQVNNIGHTMPNRIPNLLPVPALTAPRAFGRIAARQPQVAMRPAKIGGRRSIPWPRAFQRFGSASDG